MSRLKYFDHHAGRTIDLERDGCPLAEWPERFGSASFARHPDGFPLFLPPSEIAPSDEYETSDPYTVDTERGFHKRRIECTLELVGTACETTGRAPRILDLGCGMGFITQEMHERLPEAEVSGLDYSVSAIRYASEHFPGIDFIVGDAYDSPYAAEYFDIVVCNNLWEHVPDPLRLLRRISLCTRPGGFLVVSTPSRYRVGNLVRAALGRPATMISTYHVTEYTVGQVKEQLRFGGYEVRRTFSRPASGRSVAAKIVTPFIAAFIAAVGSHHRLEETVFYLAQKSDESRSD